MVWHARRREAKRPTLSLLRARRRATQQLRKLVADLLLEVLLAKLGVVTLAYLLVVQLLAWVKATQAAIIMAIIATRG